MPFDTFNASGYRIDSKGNEVSASELKIFTNGENLPKLFLKNLSSNDYFWEEFLALRKDDKDRGMTNVAASAILTLIKQAL